MVRAIHCDGTDPHRLEYNAYIGVEIVLAGRGDGGGRGLRSTGCFLCFLCVSFALLFTAFEFSGDRSDTDTII